MSRSNVNVNTAAACGADRAWAVLACAPLLLLAGCVGWQRNATWDRVTAPDYVHPGQMIQHGYHRTTWEAWSDERVLGGTWTGEQKRSTEAIPRGNPKSEQLPPPSQGEPVLENEIDTPPTGEEGFVPQAKAPRGRAIGGRRPRPLTSPLLEEAVAPEPELISTSEFLGPPAEGDAADLDEQSSEDLLEVNDSSVAAAWSDRMASLLSADRKTAWKEVDENSPQVVDQAGEAAPVIEQMSHETPQSVEPPRRSRKSPASSGDAGVKLRVAPGPSVPRPPTGELTVSPPPKAEGEVRLRLNTAK